MLVKKLSGLIILSIFITMTLAACAPTARLPVDFAGFPEFPPPYTGVIQNHSNRDVSFQSKNSGAALVVPAGKFLEFVVWSENFDLIGYVDGKPIYCQKIQVSPKSFQFKCKSYDFMAEIKKETPKKKRIKRKKRLPGGVEAYG